MYRKFINWMAGKFNAKAKTEIALLQSQVNQLAKKRVYQPRDAAGRFIKVK